MVIKINKKQAIHVFDSLLKLWQEKKYPYNIIQKPQDSFLPKNLKIGSREHALFLFCVCHYMRGAIKSDFAIKKLSLIYERNPELFKPENFSEDNCDTHKKLEIELGQDLKYRTTQNALFWKKNLLVIAKDFDSDPRNIFLDSEKVLLNYQEICDKMIGTFLGFRHKMVSMLTYFYVDAKLIKEFNFPAPIDFHLLRIMVQQGIISFKGDAIKSEKLLVFARELTSWYAQKRGVSSTDVSDALWLFSQAMCSKNPYTKIFKKGKYNGRKTEIRKKHLLNTPSTFNNYQKSCGLCCVKESCLGTVPSVNYYVKGEIQITKYKNKDIQEKLF